MIVEYKSSVCTKVGFRHVYIMAEIEKTSEKLGRVIKVLTIDDQKPIGYLSRTGSKSQVYKASGIASREIGKIKIISKCKII